jgi:hypothetical protein
MSRKPVTGPPGHRAAVLIRSAGTLTDPGRLARALNIDGALNDGLAEPLTGLCSKAATSRAGYRQPAHRRC